MPPAGVELATFSLGRSYSIQLSYGGVCYILASLQTTSNFQCKDFTLIQTDFLYEIEEWTYIKIPRITRGIFITGFLTCLCCG